MCDSGLVCDMKSVRCTSNWGGHDEPCGPGAPGQCDPGLKCKLDAQQQYETCVYWLLNGEAESTQFDDSLGLAAPAENSNDEGPALGEIQRKGGLNEYCRFLGNPQDLPECDDGLQCVGRICREPNHQGGLNEECRHGGGCNVGLKCQSIGGRTPICVE